MTRSKGNVRTEVPAQGRDDTLEVLMMPFGGKSKAAADRCDRTGAAHAA